MVVDRRRHNLELENKASNFVGKMPHRVRKKMEREIAITNREDTSAKQHKRQANDATNNRIRLRVYDAAVNQFPFTRNLERASRSANFYLYVVQLTSPLKWSEVQWKQLVVN